MLNFYYLNKKRIDQTFDQVYDNAYFTLEEPVPPVCQSGTEHSGKPGPPGSANDSGDIFSLYKNAMQQFLQQLEKTSPGFREALIYQQRLHENIFQSKVYGDDPAHKAERAGIIDMVNRLFPGNSGKSFNEICGNILKELGDKGKNPGSQPVENQYQPLSPIQKLLVLEKDKSAALRSIINLIHTPRFGQIVTFDEIFKCRNLSNHGKFLPHTWFGSTPKLECRINKVQVEIPFSPTHFVSPTIWSLLRSKVIRLEGMGIVFSQGGYGLKLNPLVFGGATD